MAEEWAKGIDVSAWQGTPNWGQVATAGLSFAFVKVSEGNGYAADYAQQWDGAKAAGLLRGGYHFFNGRVSGSLQADYFLKRAQPGELSPVVDFEDAATLMQTNITGAAMLDGLKACLERIESAWSCLPIVYTGKWFLDLCIQNSPNYNPRWLVKYPLWIANYNKSPDVEPLRPAWWDWKFYQWTSSGSVPGIVGRVDLNVFNGSVAELRAWAGVAPAELSDAEKLKRLWAAHPELAGKF